MMESSVPSVAAVLGPVAANVFSAALFGSSEACVGAGWLHWKTPGNLALPIPVPGANAGSVT